MRSRIAAALVAVCAITGCDRVFGLTQVTGADGPRDATVPNGGFTAIAATQGGHHVCAIDNATRLWCWGANDHQQSGERIEPFSGTPALASTTPEFVDGWTAIAVGTNHTCGIQRGSVVCWGKTASRQVGVAPAGDAPLTRLVLPEAPRSVDAGGDTTCAIGMSGKLYCWGVTEPATPATSRLLVQVTPGGVADGWSSVAITKTQLCARHDKRVYCWGRNDVDQLDAVGSSVTSDVAIASTFETVAVGGSNGCGIDVMQRLVCWGASIDGLLGATTTMPAINVVIDSLRTWSAISIADHHICAIAHGDVFCFGNDTAGALGDGFAGHAELAASPALTDATTDVTQIVGGDDFTCALDSGGFVWCWGTNVYGELGNGEVAYKRAPVTVVLPAGTLRAVSSGTRHTCALVDTKVYCWGDNTQGQINPALARAPLTDPTKVELAFAVDAISAGGSHTCARESGTSILHCWGNNDHGQLGVTSGSSGTIGPPPAAAWGSFSAGTSGTCAATAAPDTIVLCWGRIDATTEMATPVRITTTDQPLWNGVSVGDGFSIGVRAVAADIAIWGPDCSGELGNHTIPQMATKNLYAAISVARAGGHACASSLSAILCWGANDSSQTGLVAGVCTSWTNQTVVAAPAATQWRAPTISVAGNHSCALTTSGALYCWGDTSEVTLGGAITATAQPITAGVWSSISTAPAHTCAIDATNSSVACWGANRFGEVGDGTRFHDRPTPIAARL